MAKKKNDNSARKIHWDAIAVGLISIFAAIVIGEYFGEQQYIRTLGLLISVFATVALFLGREYGRYLWFWITLSVLLLAHAPLLLAAAYVNRLSPALMIPLGIADGVMILLVVLYVADVLGYIDPRSCKHRSKPAV